MSRRRSGSRRSSGEWLVRLALTAVVGLVGYIAVTFSLAQVLFRTYPERAHSLAPYDGRITAFLSGALSDEKATPADRRRADELALLALRQDPTVVVALSTLGLNSEVRGDVTRARQLFAGAQKLSRRDLRTQLWMIEDAVRRGDISGALRQYDITLRVFPKVWEILFPVLAAASSEPQIRSALVRTLAASPPWAAFFVDYLAGNGPDPRASARLLVALREAGGAVSDKAQASAVDQLIRAELFNEAWSYYATVNVGADRRRSRDPRFGRAAQAASQLDWQPVEDSGLSAVIQNGLFEFIAPASTGGPVLRQLQLLPEDTYSLTGHSSGIDQTATTRPYWTLTCRSGRELGRIPLPNSGEAGGTFSGTFTVGSGCPVQTLTLVAQASDAVGGSSGQIDRVQLAPVRQ